MTDGQEAILNEEPATSFWGVYQKVFDRLATPNVMFGLSVFQAGILVAALLDKISLPTNNGAGLVMAGIVGMCFGFAGARVAYDPEYGGGSGD